MPVIGFLNSASLEPNRNLVKAFVQSLSESGYVEGKNITIEYRWANGQYDRLPALAVELVQRQVHLVEVRHRLVAEMSWGWVSSFLFVIENYVAPHCHAIYARRPWAQLAGDTGCAGAGLCRMAHGFETLQASGNLDRARAS
jgi:hypothetical protein